MPHCASCDARISLNLAIKSTNALLFPEECEQCPACHAQLVPARRSIVAGVLAFIVLTIAGLTAVHFGWVGSFDGGFVAGFAAGIVISFGGLFASAALIEYDRPA
jgi:hypothetical protein